MWLQRKAPERFCMSCKNSSNFWLALVGKGGFVLQSRLAGPFALGRGESGQVRKEAATAVLLKCRSQARQPLILAKSGGIEPSLFYFWRRVDNCFLQWFH